MDADEQQVAAHTAELDTALAATGITYEIFYEEDGGEGWHITISAGREVPVGSGCENEFGLAFWTRSDEWLWGYVTREHHESSGPWPCRDLDAWADAEEVAQYVVDGLRSYGHGDDCEGCDGD